jgi:hypothetical protein
VTPTIGKYRQTVGCLHSVSGSKHGQNAYFFAWKNQKHAPLLGKKGKFYPRTQAEDAVACGFMPDSTRFYDDRWRLTNPGTAAASQAKRHTRQHLQLFIVIHQPQTNITILSSFIHLHR